MATFNVCVRNQSANEYSNVYIRVSQKSKTGYIRTSYIVHNKKIKEGIIVDKRINLSCDTIILEYIDKLNKENTKNWTVQEIISYLTDDRENISFSKWVKIRINGMINAGKENTSMTYKLALSSLSAYLHIEDISFSDITAKNINAWVESLKDTSRAKSLYPTCLKAAFKTGCDYYNDYERDIIRIKHRPFELVKIPKETPGKKRAIPVESLRKLFNSIPETEREKMALDVAMIIFCLCGINSADLYDLNKGCLDGNWNLKYNRKKTREKSDSGAYMEINIPICIRDIVKRWVGDERLFVFSEKYVDANGLSKNTNKGLKSLCDKIGIEHVTTYTFRHTWATIAQNNCGASTEMVAFALAHSSAHRVTEGYIKKDFSPIDKLNEKIINFVFNQ